MADEKQISAEARPFDSPMMGENTISDEKSASITNSAENPNGKNDYDGSVPEDAKAERRLTTKMDIRLVPILGLLYLISFLDRTNIANARLAGLEKELNMPSNGFNTSLWIFYLPFVLVEIPSNLLLSLPKVKPNMFLAGQMIILGVISTMQGVTQSYGGLLACRFLMGIFEAGLPAGSALLMASYYRKKEFAVRFAWFFALAQFANFWSGLLAYAIIDISGAYGLSGWRWIFIIEGAMTIAFGLIAWFIIPNFPQKATFLNDDERKRLLARLYVDRGEEKETMKDVKWIRVITDYKIWLLTLTFFCCDMGAASLSSFTPTIVAQLGYSDKEALKMTMPIWAVGIVCGLVFSYASSKMNIRWPFIFGGFLVSIVGWVLQYLQVQPPGVRYFAIICIAAGTFVQMPLLVGWLNSNLRGRAYLAVGTAIQLGIGNCANFVASNVFIQDERPRYPTGFGVGLGLTCLGAATTLATAVVFSIHNTKLDRRRADNSTEVTQEDDQVNYRYVM